MVKQNLNVLFFLSGKRKDKSGYCPVYARITIDGIREEFSTKCKLLPEQWDSVKKRCKGNSTLAFTTNNKLSGLKSSIEKIFLLSELDGQRVMPSMIVEKLFPKQVTSLSNTNEENSSGNQPMFILSKPVEQLYTTIIEYYKDEKKFQKIRNEQVKSERYKELATRKEEIKKTIEDLLKETNKALNEGCLEKHLMNAVYDFILSFARQVMGGKRRYSTLRKWHYTKEKIKSFCWYHYQKATLTLDEIPFSFGQDFYDYLTLVDRCGNNLAMKFIKNTKQVLDRVTDRSWIIKNPIHGFKCNYIEVERDPVFMEDIIKLINVELEESLDMVRDAFLFSIFTGFAYEDTRQLEPGDIFTGIDGKQWIGTERIKTEVREKVPLLPLPLQIISKYEQHPCRLFDNKLIPLYTNQTYNKKLKVIAGKCDIKIDLTTHIARHTFATVVTLENDMPIATVRSLMGQKLLKTTEKYAKATSIKVSRNMAVLEAKLFDKDGVLIGLRDNNIRPLNDFIFKGGK